ncbi:MAG: gliding motility-associated C-terminal domain-containing protein [Flavobacteriales bacterium]
MKTYAQLLCLFAAIFAWTNSDAQCTVQASAQDTIVPCNGSTILSVNGSGTSVVAFGENFNNGQPVGWDFSQVVTIANNTCGVPSLDGSDFMWMGNQSVAPRVMTTVPLDVSAGGNVCFEMRYAIQAQASPCEGPDLASEGVYVQYSIDAGATWVTMNYWSPNGGYDAYLTAWHQYCETIPLAAQTATTKFRWTQLAVSGAGFDHWGLDNISISATIPNYTITWLHDNYSYPTGVYTGANPTPVSPTGTTNYIVMMTDSTNICYDTITLFISYPQIDSIVENDPTCGSSNGSLVASSSGGAGGYTYSIDNGQNFQSSGTFSNLGINTYNVILVDQNNCSDTLQAELLGVDSVDISNMVVTTTTCGLDNGVIDLTVTGGSPAYQYSLTNGATFSASPIFNNLTPGVYQVYVQDLNGCFDQTTAEIYPSTNPLLGQTTSTLEFCSLQDGSISTSATLGVSPYVFVVHQGPVLVGTSSTGSFPNLNSGNYWVTVIDQIGCADSTQIIVDSIPAPVSPMLDTVLCNLTLQVFGVVTYTGSNWTSNSNLISFSDDSAANPLITADTAGVYLINMQDSICGFNQTFSLTFVADPYTSINDTTLCIGETATLAAIVQPQNVSYAWNTGSTSSTIQVTTTGPYIVATTNMCGVSIDTALVDFYFCDIEFPNVFTPNGDGSNDYFQMLFYGGLATFECIIVNRWGNTIRTFTNPAFQWDGTDENGDALEEGVYFYIAKTITNANQEIEKQGLVHLVRE